MKQKYLQKVRGGWSVFPSAKAHKCGVAPRKFFKDAEYEKALAYAKECEVKMAAWTDRRRERVVRTDGAFCVEDLIIHYLESQDFNSLSLNTRNKYKTVFKRMQPRMMRGIPLGARVVKDITAPFVATTYDNELRDSGVNIANEYIAVFRLLFNYAIRHGFIFFNPFAHVRKRPKNRRKVMWCREDVRAFLNTAFSRFKWRNVGLLFYCIYEWGQRTGDIVNLKWEQVDMINRCVSITQKKRGSAVKLPMSEGLYSILLQQQRDFVKQQWVAPQLQRQNGKWVPYSVGGINDYFTQIKTAAGLSSELQLRDLRRTAITETIENGADALQVMMLSGHNSAASLMPYFVHTLKGAQKAQEIRQFPSHLISTSPLRGRLYERRTANVNGHGAAPDGASEQHGSSIG
jgi:integrase